MAKIDWYYQRPGCKTCAKTNDYIDSHDVQVAMIESTREKVYQKGELATILKDVDEIHSVKGKSVVHVNLRQDQPDAATLEKLLLGPTGNLRSPSFRSGRTLIVGFDPATYDLAIK